MKKAIEAPDRKNIVEILVIPSNLSACELPEPLSLL
jgi:hypothetical protein